MQHLVHSPPVPKQTTPRRLQEEIYKANMVNMAYQQPQYMQPMINEEEEFEHMINHGINNILDTNSVNSL
jgi:hypothetical protein